MFEWNEEDVLTDTIWGDLIEREDHIVPYPKSSNDDALFRIEDYSNKLKDDKKCSEPWSYDQSRSSHKSFPGSDPDPSLQYHAELPGSRFCMDPLHSFSSIESTVRKEGDKNDQGSTYPNTFNGFMDSPNFNRARDRMCAEPSHSMDTENDSDCGRKEVDNFLDCDWASMTDFDDFDGIFRNNDSALGQDELFSPTYSINASAQPFLVRENEEFHGKRKNSGDDQVHEQKKLLKSRSKAEEKHMPNSQNVTSSHSHETSQSRHFEKLPPAISAFYPSAAFPQQTQVGEPAYLAYPSQQMLMGYGYPAPPFPTVPLVPFVPAANRNSEPYWVSNVYPAHVKHYNPVRNQQEASSRTLTMTPQEKIEKLRRRQQMQAMLAIKQQEKQLGQLITSVDVAFSQVPSQMNPVHSSVVNAARTEEMVPSSELKIPVEQEESHNISVSSDDSLLQETIFFELQDTVVKLDHNVRLCMRDSLFRLAKSAMERCRVTNRSGARSIKDENDILKNQQTCNQEGLSGLVDAETDTNPIDRTVAHLLFHRPPQLHFPALQQSNASDDSLQGKVEIARAMKGKTPL